MTADQTSSEVAAETARRLLNAVADPCSLAAGVPAGLVEMGLVRDLRVESTPRGAVVHATVGVTEPGCLMGAAFARSATDSLLAHPGVAEAHITLDHALDWHPDDMDPGYQARLTQARTAKRRLPLVTPAP